MDWKDKKIAEIEADRKEAVELAERAMARTMSQEEYEERERGYQEREMDRAESDFISSFAD